MRRRRGFADCYLFGDIFFAAFLAWIGMVVIVAPIITFTVMWAGAWVEPEVRPEPPRAALFAATCTMLVLGFVSLVFVEWFSGGARLSVEQLCKCRLSSCVEQAAVALFAMRSMGLAVAHCTIPHWGNRSAGHDFNAILTRDNEWADFSAAKFNPGENEMANKPPKVFVKKFSRKMMPEDELEIVRRFDFPYAGYQDVTSHLVKTSDVTVRIPDSLKKDVSVVYLCVFYNFFCFSL